MMIANHLLRHISTACNPRKYKLNPPMACLVLVLALGHPCALSPCLFVGASTCDDAAVFKINEQQAVVLTTDFFMPMGA